MAAREDAQESGYEINARYQCIDKVSYDAVNAQRRAWEQRRGFKTAIALQDSHPLRLPNPPVALFVRSDYRNAQHYMLPAFVSPNPREGRRRPATKGFRR